MCSSGGPADRWFIINPFPWLNLSDRFRVYRDVLTPPETTGDGALATVAEYGIYLAIPRPESEIFEVERTCQPVLWSSSRASRAPCGVDSKTGAGKARF